jgi:ribosome maturation factor RimP
MKIETRIGSLVERELERIGYELVKLEVSLRSPRKVIRIFIDHPERGVTLDNCVQVTRAIGFVLDGENVIPGSYHLEVSSPGIDRPLTKAAHFERFKGKQAKVERMRENGTRETFIGEIVGVKGDTITFLAGGTEAGVALADIVRANLHGEQWDPGGGKRRAGRKKRRR